MTDRYSSFETLQDDKQVIVDHHPPKTVLRASPSASRRSASPLRRIG
jgi:hypothetical protein